MRQTLSIYQVITLFIRFSGEISMKGMLNVFVHTNATVELSHSERQDTKHPIYFIIHKFKNQWDGKTCFFFNAMLYNIPDGEFYVFLDFCDRISSDLIRLLV